MSSVASKQSKLISLKEKLESPITSIIVGVIMIACGIFEFVETFFEESISVEIGTHHAILIFASHKVLHAFVEVIEGVSKVGISEEEEKLENIITKKEFRD